MAGNSDQISGSRVSRHTSRADEGDSSKMTRSPPGDSSKDDFPYKRLQGDMKTDITRRFRALMTWRPTFRVSRYRIMNAPELQDKHLRFCFGGQRDPMIMEFRASDYDDYNLISDYFIEEHRIQAIRSDDPKRESVYDYWLANRDVIREACRDTRRITLKPPRIIGVYPRNDQERRLTCMREMIYAGKMEVGTFRPTVAAGIIGLMRGKMGTRCDYVLDPCAGWGDRLIGIMAAGARGSVHVDPNPALGAEYTRMHDWIRATEPEKFADYRREYFPKPFEDIPREDLLRALSRVRGQGDETFVARDDGFDLTIIAPPYFDLEIYVPNDMTQTQSISRYREWNEWYEKFLIASLAKASSVLRVGGVLALIINEPPDRTSPRFLEHLGFDVTRAAQKTMEGVKMRYLGVISYAELKANTQDWRSPQPIWLWMRERQ